MEMMELCCVGDSSSTRSTNLPGWYTITQKDALALEKGAIIQLKSPTYEFLSYSLIETEKVEIMEYEFDGEFGYIRTPYNLYGVRIVEE